LSKKHLKINIKNTQLAKALDLSGVKDKLAKKKASKEELEEKAPPKKEIKKSEEKPKLEEVSEIAHEEGLEAPHRKAKARSKSVFVHEETKEPQKIGAHKEGVSELIEEKAPEPVIKEVAPALETEKLGPTGRHVKDLIPPKKKGKKKPEKENTEKEPKTEKEVDLSKQEITIGRESFATTKKTKSLKFKEYKDFKPIKRSEDRSFDARDRHGLRSGEEEFKHRKKKSGKIKMEVEEVAILRPTSLKIRLPTSIKDLSYAMKLKASEVIAKLFTQGLIVTINDLLDDETTVQLLGQEFGCEISIDTSEQERLRVTDVTVQQEISSTTLEKLQLRPPVVAFMGHVDHGKTSLIDSIRKSNIASGEAGAITQHIGAFRTQTAVGSITILDTPGHEAFTAMRARGATATDIVVLVVAGDEGIRQQTLEAIQHARAAKVSIVVAINKSDKPNFNAENVYRQLADIDLLPEVWGGQTITVNCSAKTGSGVKELLEMLALQAEVLELKANPEARARGVVLESEMHKGLGATATILVQNGTLKNGDPILFDIHWGRVKTMHDEHGNILDSAGPSTPVRITGISGIPESGQEFIVVPTEKEAREIAEARSQGVRLLALQQRKKMTVENLFAKASESAGRKVLNVILRADVQGSVEALKAALQKIESDKIVVDVIFIGVGDITESDVQLAEASNAMILGFHTQVESHAESLLKDTGVVVRLHDIIYHAIDDVKEIMVTSLDKIAQENEKGKAEVRATFKASQLGIIAGCFVTEGSISRNDFIRVRREGNVIWTGKINSLKRVKEDVKEVKSGFECGILLEGNNDVKEKDILEAFDINYITQQL